MRGVKGAGAAAGRAAQARAAQERARPLGVGVESIARWRIDDEQHLPSDRQAPGFLPETRALDDILRRPSLDERLPDLLRPDTLDPDLMHPAVMSAMREGMARRFRDLETAPGIDAGQREAFAAAAAVMESDASLDKEVRASLAVLLRG